MRCKIILTILFDNRVKCSDCQQGGVGVEMVAYQGAGQDYFKTQCSCTKKSSRLKLGISY